MAKQAKVPIKALVKIVEYMEDDEQKHYEEMEGEDRSDHIYLSVRAVAKWLRDQGINVRHNAKCGKRWSTSLLRMA